VGHVWLAPKVSCFFCDNERKISKRQTFLRINLLIAGARAACKRSKLDHWSEPPGAAARDGRWVADTQTQRSTFPPVTAAAAAASF
jgi:hypothetical protein